MRGSNEQAVQDLPLPRYLYPGVLVKYPLFFEIAHGIRCEYFVRSLSILASCWDGSAVQQHSIQSDYRLLFEGTMLPVWESRVPCGMILALPVYGIVGRIRYLAGAGGVQLI